MLQRFSRLFCARPVVRTLTLILAAVVLGAPARGQLHEEPPDLSNTRLVPTTLGAVVGGSNVILGTVSATWTNSGVTSGDPVDAASFVVPPGYVLFSVEIFVSNRLCNNCTSVLWGDAALGGGSVTLTGNGAFSLPITASGPGTYVLEVSTTRGGLGAGSGSLSYFISIVAGPENNDTCQYAAPVGLGATPFSNVTATTDGGPLPGCDVLSADLWYLYTASADGILKVSTCGSSFDTVLAVYQGPCSPSALPIVCNDNAPSCGEGSEVQLLAAPGQVYRIRVGGLFGRTGNGVLTLSLDTSGACCNRTTGGCLVLPSADCATFGGNFGGIASTCSPSTCVACPADFNNSGAATVQDIFDFLAAYFAGCP